MRNVRTLMVGGAVALAASSLAVGCGDSSSSDEPGAVGGSGNEDAGGLDAASGGAAGKGGSAGAAGSAGKGGSAGAGGSAGKGGSAGAAGSAGKGGAAGAGGSGPFCTPGATQPCYTGPSGTKGVGLCAEGTQTCQSDGSAWGACAGEVVPATESCLGAGDEDCDGQANEDGEGCICVPGATEACYSGPPSTKDVGICVGGTHTCNPTGTDYGPCSGEVTPATETCATPEDEDCDGAINEEGAECVCVPGSEAECYTGPAGTQGVGLCTAGKKVCASDGKSYGACMGEVLPASETCNSGGDDDCDGQTNEEGEGCACLPGAVQECYSGPPQTKGVGTCTSGTQTCQSDGTAWGACQGEITPVEETCATPQDEDCDGQTNESGEGCVCLPNATSSCYTGPSGTLNIGVCKAGTKTCNEHGTAYGPCGGDTLPATEICKNLLDDDCDGSPNQGCVYASCNEILQNNPGSLSGTYTIDPDGEGSIAPVAVYCDMTTDGGGYTMVRFDNVALNWDQGPYAQLCASHGLEIIVPRTKAHAASINAWNGNTVPNLYNVFPKYNGATAITNWQAICKGSPCTFWMTDNANGDVGCYNFEPNGDNNTAYRIFKRSEGCGIQGNWNDQSNYVAVQGWVICSTNDK